MLHCDPTASHYLKVLLDGVLGPGLLPQRDCLAVQALAGPSVALPADARHPPFLHGRARRGHTFHTLYGYEKLAESTRKTFGTRKQKADFSSGRHKPGSRTSRRRAHRSRTTGTWAAPPATHPSATAWQNRRYRGHRQRAHRISDAEAGGAPRARHQGEQQRGRPRARSVLRVRHDPLAVADRLKRRWIGIDVSHRGRHGSSACRQEGGARARVRRRRRSPGARGRPEARGGRLGPRWARSGDDAWPHRARPRPVGSPRRRNLGRGAPGRSRSSRTAHAPRGSPSSPAWPRPSSRTSHWPGRKRTRSPTPRGSWSTPAAWRRRSTRSSGTSCTDRFPGSESRRRGPAGGGRPAGRCDDRRRQVVGRVRRPSRRRLRPHLGGRAARAAPGSSAPSACAGASISVAARRVRRDARSCGSIGPRRSRPTGSTTRACSSTSRQRPSRPGRSPHRRVTEDRGSRSPSSRGGARAGAAPSCRGTP